MSRTVTVLLLCLALAAPGCVNGSRSREELYRDGLAQLRAKDPGAAVISFKKALAGDDSFFEARHELGRVYLMLGKYAAAVQELQKALDRQPDSAQVRKDLGRACALAGRPDDALHAVAPLLPAPDAEVLEIAGWARAQKGEHQGALALLRRAAEQEPRRRSTGVTLARVYLIKGDHREAAAEVRSVLAADPGDLSALAVLAEVQLKQGDEEAALATYDRIIAKAPGSGAALLRKGLLLIELGRPEQALAPASLLAGRPADEADGYELRGRALVALNDPAGAIAALQKAASLRSSPELHHLLALCHHANNEPEQALNQVQQALALKPDLAEARLLAALIDLDRNRPDEALREANRVLAADDRNPAAHFMAACAALAQGRQQDGLAGLDRALALAPGMVEARIRKASVQAAAGRTKEAERELMKAVSADPDRQSSRAALASFYLGRNQPGKAEQAARQGLRNTKDDALFHTLIADANLQQGRMDDALAALDKARAADPKAHAAFFRTAVLYQVRGEQERALDLLTDLARKAPGNAEAQLAAAMLLEQTGRKTDSAELYERARKTGTPRAARALAARSAAQGRPGEALTLLDEGLRKYPDDGQLLVLKADISRAAKRYQDAVQAAEALMRTDPARGLRSLIDTHLAQGRPDKAKERLSHELTRDPKRQDLRALLCSVQIRMEQLRGAAETARAMMDDQPGSPAGYLCQADVQQAAGGAVGTPVSLPPAQARKISGVMPLRAGLEQGRNDSNTLLALLTRAETLDAASLEATLRKAALLQEMGRTGEAAAAYRTVLQRSPDHVPALNNLAYLLAEEPATAGAALPHAVRAVMLAPGESAVADTLGYVLLRNGRTDAGLKILKQASSLAPDDPSICYHLALALRDSRDRAGAVTYLEKALSRGNFPERAAASALLSGLKAP